ncbi:winged helix-turn-helix transcriptional regulator [Streptomyces hainanensis]|uniref:MarR family transcriptional regulator n=1 Tax=Streptomyces hainanensis TaxID=402648 RepID=A0A4R4T6C3_9ACTN|nr:MarR family transcriptional regulator [Streptomyces hainanensis]
MSINRWQSLAPVQIERAELAASTLKPRWSMWVLQTLEHNGPMRLTDLCNALPGLQPSAASSVINRLRGQGLITRTPSGRSVHYGLGDAANGLQPVHRTLASWWQAHLSINAPVARAEQVERGLGHLPLPATFAICKSLADRGPQTATDVGWHLDWPMATSSFYSRIAMLRHRGLIAPTGDRIGKAELLSLTPRALSLSDVVEALDDFQRHRAPASVVPTATPPYRPADLFSHLPTTPAPMPRPLAGRRPR